MPSNKSQPRFRKKLSIDSRGFFRIGGKFASGRQVGAWRRENRKRNLPSGLPKRPSVTSIKSARSRSAKKSAVTRSIKSTGIPPVQLVELRTVNQRIYTIPLVDIGIFDERVNTIITDLFRRENLEQLKNPLVFVVLQGEDREGEDTSFSTRFVSLDSSDAVERLTRQIVELANSYDMVVVNELVFVVSFSKERK